jgi:hypothetical protein
MTLFSLVPSSLVLMLLWRGGLSLAVFTSLPLEPEADRECHRRHAGHRGAGGGGKLTGEPVDRDLSAQAETGPPRPSLLCQGADGVPVHPAGVFAGAIVLTTGGYSAFAGRWRRSHAADDHPDLEDAIAWCRPA